LILTPPNKLAFFFRPVILHINPPGKVLPSVLVAHGVHCRLENLSDEGRWLEDESFYHLGQLVVRKAGELAPPSTMAGWRKLRKHDPGLFSTIRVWQQPCAVADSIIWRWQLNLEASEYRQAVRVTDCLGAVWTPDSKEAAFSCSRSTAH